MTPATQTGSPWPEHHGSDRFYELERSPLYNEDPTAAAAVAGEARDVNMLPPSRGLIDNRFTPTTEQEDNILSPPHSLPHNSNSTRPGNLRRLLRRSRPSSLERRRWPLRGEGGGGTIREGYRFRLRKKKGGAKERDREREHGASDIRVWTWWDTVQKAPGLMARMYACGLAVCALWSTSLTVAGTLVASLLTHAS